MSEEYEGEKEVGIQGRTYLVPLADYIQTGVSIGTKACTKHMKRFVRVRRPTGLSLLDLDILDERISVAAKAIARANPERVLVVSCKEYGVKPVEKFCQYTGCKSITGRFPPGIFSNPKYSGYISPELVVISDPKVDQKTLIEASVVGVPVIALCDTDDICSDVDLVIPVNNKGRKSLALVFWLLAREVCRRRGIIPPDASLPEGPEAFETPPGVEEVEQTQG